MELTLSDDVGFFAVGMVLVVPTVSIAVFFVPKGSFAVFFTRDESDGKDVLSVLVVTAAVSFDGDESSGTGFGTLFLVLRIFVGGGSFAARTGRGLSFSLRRCDCRRGVGGAVVTAVPFFFGGIAWMVLSSGEEYWGSGVTAEATMVTGGATRLLCAT